jgi:hypothetical protein
MAQILSASIDVMKIDRTKLIKGEKGTYLNIQIAINDEKDQYGNDCSVSINQTKEERENKEPKIYLGNGKIVWSSAQKTEAVKAEVVQENDNLDLPF